MHIALLMVLFGSLRLGLFWEGGVLPTPPSVACTSAVMSRHSPRPARCSGEVPAEHQWAWWGANFFCVSKESLS